MLILLLFCQTAGAQDYHITTTNGHLTLTDQRGGNDVFTKIIQNGNNIVLSAISGANNSILTCRINGGAVQNLSNLNFSLVSIHSITFNLGEGNDRLDFGAFTTLFPTLTVNGGKGNDYVNFAHSITFAENASLDLDFQNDDPDPGSDEVVLHPNCDLVFSGTGSAIIKVSKTIFLIGGSIQTEDGNLTLEANQQPIPTSGSFMGVDVSSGGFLRVTGSGALTVKGRGGDDNPTFIGQTGVRLREGAKIIGSTDSPVTVHGTGGACIGTFNHGVHITGTESSVTSAGGDIHVTGVGGGTGTSNQNLGVFLQLSGSITATGNGTVHVQGTGGGGSGNGNYGVHLLGPSLISSGNGTLTVHGTGGAGTGNSNYGILVNGYQSGNCFITSGGGDVHVTGQGGGTGSSASNHGVNVQSTGVITAGGVGAVFVDGAGGESSGAGNVGVFVTESGSFITSSGGAVSVTGRGGGTANSTNNFGVALASSGTITAGGSAGVSVTGVEGQGAGSVGLYQASGSNITTASHGGNITLTSNSMNIFSGTLISTGAHDQVYIHPYSPDVPIGLGIGGNPIGGPLNLSNAELEVINPTGALIIGDVNSGDIIIHSAIVRSAATDLQLISGGNIIFSEGGINTAGGDLRLHPGESPAAVKPDYNGTDVNLGSSGTLSFGSDLSITINGTVPGNGTSGTYTQLAVNGTIDLTGVELKLSGNHVPIPGQVFIIVDNIGPNAVTGTFTNLPEGSSIENFLDSGLPASVTYAGGGGNDIVLTVLSPDYILTTTGNAIVITDVSGNSDELTLTRDGTGIHFATAVPRTFRVDNGVMAAMPVSLPLGGVTSIMVNAGAGDDIISVGDFSDIVMPVLVINGDEGDDQVNLNGDLLFAPNANLGLDLQNDVTVPGNDRITVATNAGIFLTGNGTAFLKVSRDIVINGSIMTENGNIIVEANQQEIPTSGDFAGVDVSGGRLEVSGAGSVTVNGKGGDGWTAQDGVRVRGGGEIKGGTGAALLVHGIGGRSVSEEEGCTGVFVEGDNSRISSSGCNVQVIGLGGGVGNSSYNHGVNILGGGSILAGVDGTVTVNGKGGGSAGSANYGVQIGSGNALITSSGGAVYVTGQGGGSGAASLLNLGISLFSSGRITAGGLGTVTVYGTGGISSPSGNTGVYATGNSTAITSSGGDVVVIGQGGGSGTGGSNRGVYVLNGAHISAGESGKVTIEGKGGEGAATTSHGVQIVNANAAVTSSGGDIQITGIENSGTGILLTAPGMISTAENGGNITLIANSMDIGGDISTSVTDNVTLRAYSNNTSIDLGTTTDLHGGPLGLSGSEINRVTTGALIIGSADSGNIVVTDDIACTEATNIELHSGADINFGGGGIHTAGGSLRLYPGNTPAAVYPAFGGTDADLGEGALSFGSDLAIVINGAVPGNGTDGTYTELTVDGTIDLSGVALVLSGSHTPVAGQTFTLVNNLGANAVAGTFSGLSEGAELVNVLGSGLNAQITYQGGDGNDVVLTVPVACENYGNIVYVNGDAAGNNNGTSWTHAFTSLQDALAMACTCEGVTKVWVAKGTYYPDEGAGLQNNNRASTFRLCSSVAVYGGFEGNEEEQEARNWKENETLLSGDLNQSNHHDDSDAYHVVTGSGTDDTAVIDGFIITGGNASGEESDGEGGGMYTLNGAPVVRNSIFRGNQAIKGGAIANSASSPWLVNVSVTGNALAGTEGYGGGVFNTNSSSLTLKNVTISGNAREGIYNSGSGLFVDNSIIWGNGTAIDNPFSDPAQVTYSIVEGGFPGTGNLDADPLFVNSPAHNTAPFTGGDYRLQPGSPAINAGFNVAFPYELTTATDLEGNPRLQNYRIDMGAYEYDCIETAPVAGLEISRPLVAGDNYLYSACSLLAIVTPDEEEPVGVITVTTASADALITHHNARYLRSYYDIAVEHPVGAVVTLFFSQAELDYYNTTFGDENNAQLPENLRVARYSGSYAVTGNNLSSDDAPYYITPSAVIWNDAFQVWEVSFTTPGFSGFFITGQSDGALPVALADFNAAVQEQSVLLTWQTTSEINVSHFEVERSADSKNWQLLQQVAAAGNSDALKTYRYRDYSPLPGLAYYRLKMVDRDGSYAYSLIRSVSMKHVPDLKIYPNPAADRFYLLTEAEVAEVLLWDVSGRLLYRDSYRRNEGVPLTGRGSGWILVEVRYADGTTRTGRIVRDSK